VSYLRLQGKYADDMIVGFHIRYNEDLVVGCILCLCMVYGSMSY